MTAARRGVFLHDMRCVSAMSTGRLATLWWHAYLILEFDSSVSQLRAVASCVHSTDWDDGELSCCHLETYIDVYQPVPVAHYFRIRLPITSGSALHPVATAHYFRLRLRTTSGSGCALLPDPIAHYFW